MISFQNRAPAGRNLRTQPDGGAYQDCTMLRVDSGHSTAHWHDIPCSLGRLAFYNGDGIDLIKPQSEDEVLSSVQSYICKMRSNRTTDKPEVKTSIPLQIGGNATVASLLPVATERYFVCKNQEIISIQYVCNERNDCRDKSDEEMCTKDCPESNFSATTPSAYPCPPTATTRTTVETIRTRKDVCTTNAYPKSSNAITDNASLGNSSVISCKIAMTDQTNTNAKATVTSTPPFSATTVHVSRGTLCAMGTPIVLETRREDRIGRREEKNCAPKETGGHAWICTSWTTLQTTASIRLTRKASTVLQRP
ncbi:low-density lipoprotein receptor-related protein 2 [Caerostris extrusa]|uniref:Low-density lipoprotein receptor-related protein 2 n=1 Tax=Caerostris extrusa TaxID=172846 RepID=A0AAV4PXU2_CAEEX|nr:low-density lipoprotein receptor-related protein 2 [Caerostris extrusa]